LHRCREFSWHKLMLKIAKASGFGQSPAIGVAESGHRNANSGGPLSRNAKEHHLSRHPNLRPIPAQPGNRLAERHGFYATVLAPAELAELAEIASALRELSPINSDGLEPLVQLVAGQLWRRRKAYADLEANGVVRTRGKAAPILRDLETLERSILEGLKALSLTPQAAASLGKTLSETRKRRYDWTRLTPTEKQKVDALIGKAEVPDE